MGDSVFPCAECDGEGVVLAQEYFADFLNFKPEFADFLNFKPEEEVICPACFGEGIENGD